MEVAQKLVNELANDLFEDFFINDDNEEETEKKETQNTIIKDDVLGDVFSEYLKTISDIPVLTKNEEITLFNRLKNGEDVSEEIITHNLKLVVSVAKKFICRCKTLEIMDLVQEGNFGLFKAIKSFDVSLGYKFSTYATWWIKQYIIRAITDTDASIRIPVYIHDKWISAQKLINEFVSTNGRMPNREEMTNILKEKKISIDSLYAFYNIMNTQNVFSLDVPFVTEMENTITFGEMCVSDDVGPEEIVTTSTLQEDFLKVMSCLSEKEYYVIEKRMGFNGNIPTTLETISQELGITRERVRQIETNAINKLRRKKKKFEELI